MTEDRNGDRWVHVITPEGADLVFGLATVGERLIAFSVDFVFSQLISILFLIAGLATSALTASEHVFAFAMIAWFVVRQSYFLFFEAILQGATPAKRMLGLRVISSDGAKLTIESIVARSLLRDLELFVPLMVAVAPQQFIGPSPWWLRLPAMLWVLLFLGLPFLTRERTRAGDMVAGTIVVRVPKVQLARDEAEGTRARIQFTKEQLAIYGEHELETLAELLRKLDVGKTTDDDLRIVAQAIARRIRFEGSEPTRDAGLFLRTFYREQRTELERELVLGRRIADKNERKDRRPGQRS